MSFSEIWHTLLEAAEERSPEATLITPLSHIRFRITDTQEFRVIIEIPRMILSRSSATSSKRSIDAFRMRAAALRLTGFPRMPNPMLPC